MFDLTITLVDLSLEELIKITELLDSVLNPPHEPEGPTISVDPTFGSDL